jgi:hypothetical protein
VSWQETNSGINNISITGEDITILATTLRANSRLRISSNLEFSIKRHFQHPTPTIMSKASTQHYAHDHVILLLDTPEFENPPAWLTDNFNIIEGGTHAGKLETFQCR